MSDIKEKVVTQGSLNYFSRAVGQKLSPYFFISLSNIINEYLRPHPCLEEIKLSRVLHYDPRMVMMIGQVVYKTIHGDHLCYERIEEALSIRNSYPFSYYVRISEKMDKEKIVKRTILHPVGIGRLSTRFHSLKEYTIQKIKEYRDMIDDR